jgi:hypothetical protein
MKFYKKIAMNIELEEKNRGGDNINFMIHSTSSNQNLINAQICGALSIHKQPPVATPYPQTHSPHKIRYLCLCFWLCNVFYSVTYIRM